MNPWYALMESAYRWQYAAAMLFTAGCVGAMMMIAYVWPQNVARVWFYACLIGTLFFLARAYLEWRQPPDTHSVTGSAGNSSATRTSRDGS